MRFPLSSVLLTALQHPFQFRLPLPGFRSSLTTVTAPRMPQKFRADNPNFTLREGKDIFSPRDLVGLARPGAGVANDEGDLVLVSSSKYDFEEKKNKKSLFIAPLNTKIAPLELPLARGGEAFWIGPRMLAHVVEREVDKDKAKENEKDKDAKKADPAVLEIYAISVEFFTELTAPHPPKLIGTIPTTTATNFRYNSQAHKLVFSDKVYADGSLKNVAEHDAKWEARGTTALVYDSTYIRHWDTWVGPRSNTLFSVGLVPRGDAFELEGEFVNLLDGTGHSTPVEPFGGTDDFDVSATHVVYTTKDPELPAAWHTRQNVYIVDIEGKEKPRELTSGKQGATHSPVFDSKAKRVAWLEMAKDGYEADRNKITVYDLETNERTVLAPDWDRSPDSLAFSKDDSVLYLTVSDEAKVKVFALPLADGAASTPTALTQTGAASGLQTLPGGRVLFSRSSLTAPNDVFLLSPSPSSATPSIASEEQQITRFTAAALQGKRLDAGDEVWFEGAGGRKVHGWVLKPPGFKEGEKAKWPAVLLIHGGPQSSWADQWSTRWNPNVWAQQGYVVFAPNPTGSTSFGQEFTDAIAQDWGGRPFVDIQAGWKSVLDKYPEIDSNRTVGAGASWGGYAINWIQGHPEYDFGFKALFCHDGVFDASYNGYSTEELFFFNHEWGGRPWEKRSKELLAKMSPANFVDKWGTPMLIVHGSKDYRLPETEGIGAFHALQQLDIPSRLVVFPDENHWVLNHGNSLKWHHEVFKWFDRFVGADSK